MTEPQDNQGVALAGSADDFIVAAKVAYSGIDVSQLRFSTVLLEWHKSAVYEMDENGNMLDSIHPTVGRLFALSRSRTNQLLNYARAIEKLKECTEDDEVKGWLETLPESRIRKFAPAIIEAPSKGMRALMAARNKLASESELLTHDAIHKAAVSAKLIKPEQKPPEKAPAQPAAVASDPSKEEVKEPLKGELVIPDVEIEDEDNNPAFDDGAEYEDADADEDDKEEKEDETAPSFGDNEFEELKSRCLAEIDSVIRNICFLHTMEKHMYHASIVEKMNDVRKSVEEWQ